MDEVAVVRAVLASMGVTDYDPKVATLLAEYLRRNVDEVLVESLDYAKYAGRKHIDLSDARLAAQARDASDGYNNYSPIPQRDRMLQVAHMINRQPIDSIPADYQLQLPPIHEAQGDAVLGANYVATTPHAAKAGGGAGGGAQAMEVGTGEGEGQEEEEEEEEAPPRAARRGEKDLRLMMSSSPAAGGSSS